LFFLLLMGLWWGLEERRYGRAAVCAGLLPLCRGVGAFAVLPLAWHALSVAPPGWWVQLEAWGAGQWRGRRQKEEGRRKKVEDRLGSTETRPAGSGSGVWGFGSREKQGSAGASSYRAWTLLAAPVLGWGTYLGLMWLWTGNAFAGLEAQKYWQVHSIGNLWNMPKFVAGFFEVSAWHEFRGSVLDRCLFVLLVYTLPTIWRWGKDMVVWTYVLGILPAMSGTFTSFTRFESCAFPLFIALAAFFTGLKRKWPLVLFIILSATLHAVLLWRFVNHRWAG
ncbi:MAG: hypothetical protein M1541_07590, partial [Acidobacteria bacterium]|nr:hypothetical protein [Acidobacteriota bacterium]